MIPSVIFEVKFFYCGAVFVAYGNKNETDGFSLRRVRSCDARYRKPYIAIGKLNQTWERPKDWQQTPVLQMKDQDLEEVSIALP